MSAIGSLEEIRPPPDLKIIALTSRWGIAEFSRCMLVVWRDQMTLDPILIRERALLDLAARHGGHCACIEVIEATSPPPSNDVRPAAMRVFAQLAKELTCIALVLEGSSVKQTLNRAIITAMGFLVPQPLPTKVFKHLSPMSAWVRDAIGTVSPSFQAEISSAITYLRAQIASSTVA